MRLPAWPRRRPSPRGKGGAPGEDAVPAGAPRLPAPRALLDPARRGRIVEEALRRAGEELERRPVVVLAGRRGSGRSSLAEALLSRGESSRPDGAAGGIAGIELRELPALDGPATPGTLERVVDLLCSAHACLVVAPAPGRGHGMECAFMETLRRVDRHFPCLLAGSRIDLLARPGPWDPAALDLAAPRAPGEKAIRAWADGLAARCDATPGRFCLTATAGRPRDAGGCYGIDSLAAMLVGALPAAVQARAARALDVEADRRALARKIIRGAAAATMAASFTPLPLLDFAGITAAQIIMLVAISRLYGRGLEAATAASLIVSTGWAGIPWLTRSLAESAPKWLPGAGTLAGGMLEATMEAPLTMALGETYLERFARKDFAPGPEEVKDCLRRNYAKALRERRRIGRLAWFRSLRGGGGLFRHLRRDRLRAAMKGFGGNG